MSSLLVDHGRHLLGDHALDDQAGSDWAKASAAVSQSKTHIAEEIRGLTRSAPVRDNPVARNDVTYMGTAAARFGAALTIAAAGFASTRAEMPNPPH
jgi:hypothetical protein